MSSVSKKSGKRLKSTIKPAGTRFRSTVCLETCTAYSRGRQEGTSKTLSTKFGEAKSDQTEVLTTSLRSSLEKVGEL